MKFSMSLMITVLMVRVWASNVPMRWQNKERTTALKFMY
jgi:hypothetical protein